jgi:hypothetical protein
VFETYRMLGREHEADLAREAEKFARAAEVRRPSASGRWFSRLRALVAKLAKLTSPRLRKEALYKEGGPRHEGWDKDLVHANAERSHD